MHNVLPHLELACIFLENTLQGYLEGIANWEPNMATIVYLVHYQFNAGSVSLILNIITGNIYPQYHVVFDDTISTVYHIRKGTV